MKNKLVIVDLNRFEQSRQPTAVAQMKRLSRKSARAKMNAITRKEVAEFVVGMSLDAEEKRVEERLAKQAYARFMRRVRKPVDCIPTYEEIFNTGPARLEVYVNQKTVASCAVD